MHAGSCENTYKKTRKSWSSGGTSWNFVTSERGSRESEEGRGGGKEGEMLLSVYCRVLLPPFVTRIPTSFLLCYEDPRGGGYLGASAEEREFERENCRWIKLR